MKNLRQCLSAVAAIVATTRALHAQQPFDLDPSFRTHFNDWYVSSIYPQPDGKVIISGQISFPGAEPLEYCGIARLNANGSWDPTFTVSSWGSGKITPWNNGFYISSIQSIRRVNLDGSLDMGYAPGVVPYFESLQGGDYHVYPDGRILMSGVHQIDYPAGGWVGFYNLIWFTNTGYLDTTRTPHAGDGVIYRFKELPDGKFICSGPMSQFDGHATSGIFRVHADGALDTTFYTGMNWGQVGAYYPMDNGRCIVGGLFKIAGNPDTLSLVRFMADGSLDPTFNNGHAFNAPPPITAPFLRGVVSAITPLDDGRLIVTGTFRDVDGIARGSICLIDTLGQLLDDHFASGGCGPHTYQGFTDAAIQDILFTTDSMCYIWGDYHGYDDGTTNDTLQRFVTRLYGPDFSTGVRDESTRRTTIRVYPNPTTFNATLQLDAIPHNATLVIRDALGREVQRLRITDHYTMLALQGAGGGVYVVEVWDANGRVATERVVVE